ncbi:hypothetical protein L218DRAFT_955381 [Marasmius fiardii PR-910]|nr:hypothetical protein L218DRAFT_955381 [Marasmius fiardii PR-910]
MVVSQGVGRILLLGFHLQWVALYIQKLHAEQERLALYCHPSTSVSYHLPAYYHYHHSIPVVYTFICIPHSTIYPCTQLSF